MFYRFSCYKYAVFPSKITLMLKWLLTYVLAYLEQILFKKKAIKTQAEDKGWLLVPELLHLSMCRHVCQLLT